MNLVLTESLGYVKFYFDVEQFQAFDASFFLASIPNK